MSFRSRAKGCFSALFFMPERPDWNDGKGELKGECMGKADRTASIEQKCRRIAEQMNFELVEIALDREPAGLFLRIYIDSPKGITLDDCEKYHRAILPAVENFDYDYMEVSSPGIDRPLKTDRDYERNLGLEVEVRLYKPVDGARQVTGTLADFDREKLVLETASGRTEILRSSVALVRPAVDMEGIENVDLGEDEALPDR